MAMRLRERGKLEAAPLITVHRRFQTCAETSWTQTSSFSPCTVGHLEKYSDVTIPKFEKQRAEGKLFFNPMTQSKVTSTILDPGQGKIDQLLSPPGCSSPLLLQEGKHDGPGCVYYRFHGAFYLGDFPIPSEELILTDQITDLIDEVTTKVLAGRGKADNNLFESIAEYRQTLGMFRKAFSGAWKWFSKNEKAIKLMKPQDAWLTYRYGIMPLVRDVEAIAKGLKQKVGKRRKTTRASLTTRKTAGRTFDSGNSFSTLKYFTSQQTADEVTVRGMSLDEYVADVYSNIGFTGKGLITTPWELIPYSFVVDWFVNVGDFINALAPAPGYDQLGTSLTVHRLTSTLYTCQGMQVIGSNNAILRNPTGQFVGTKESKSRGVLGLPSIGIKHSFRLDEGIRLADSAALLAQKIIPMISGRK